MIYLIRIYISDLRSTAPSPVSSTRLSYPIFKETSPTIRSEDFPRVQIFAQLELKNCLSGHDVDEIDYDHHLQPLFESIFHRGPCTKQS